MGEILEAIFEILYIKGVISLEEWEKIQNIRDRITPATDIAVYMCTVKDCIDPVDVLGER